MGSIPFEVPRKRTKLTRQQKRDVRKQFSAVKTRDSHYLDLTTEEFSELQQTDPSLQETWTAFREKKLTGDKFFLQTNILYREWSPPGQTAVIEQLVLPQKCRAKVLELAHQIPLAGHLGRDKTADRLYSTDFTGQLCIKMWASIVVSVKYVRRQGPVNQGVLL